MSYHAKITSKGQITIPRDIREALGVGTGDTIEFLSNPKGGFRIRGRKRRSIVDFARENPIEPKEPVGDIDALIERSIGAAVEDRRRRNRAKA
jgi:AbrB family looped-hinge helix DNA binding protein